MRGVYGYLTGTIKKPPSASSTSTITTKPTTTLTEKETTTPTPVLATSTPIETRWQSLTPSEDEWDSRDNWVRGLLLYNTKNPVGLGIKTRGTAAESWASYVERYEVSTKMARLAAEQDLKNTTYSERQDFSTHVSILRSKWAKANLLGATIDDEDFKMILLTSLPASWNPIIATCIKDGTSTEAISLLETWSLHFSPKSSINPVAALQVTKPPRKDRNQLVCINPNCNRQGHTIEMCYWRGGGKEGQFPLGFGKRGRFKGTAINTKQGGFNWEPTANAVEVANNEEPQTSAFMTDLIAKVLQSPPPTIITVPNNTPSTSFDETTNQGHDVQGV